MTNETLHVNEEENDLITLDEDDSSFKYTIVPNELIRDQSISPNCRWLIIFLISNRPGWTIKSRQLWEHTKGFIGREGIRKLLNEAIEAGYILRSIVPMKGKNKNLRGYSYKVASTPKFKKCFREPNSRGPEPRGPENWGSKEVLSKELLSINTNTSLKVSTEQATIADANAAKAADEILENPIVKDEGKPKKTRIPADFTPKIRELADRMMNALVASNPDWIPPQNMYGILSQIDLLLNHDKRSSERVFDVFMWAISDHFWSSKFGKPNPVKYLRDKFAQLASAMDAKPPKPARKFSPCSNDEESLENWREAEKSAI